MTQDSFEISWKCFYQFKVKIEKEALDRKQLQEKKTYEDLNHFLIDNNILYTIIL